MSDQMPSSWPRPYFTEPSEPAFVFYVAYGKPEDSFRISRSTYRCAGVTEGLEMMQYGPEVHPEVPASFREGYLWDELKASDPGLAAEISAQDHCTILRGEFADTATLDALRDTIGLLTWLVDHGCVAIYDPQMFRWWSVADWKAHAFAPDPIEPHQHVVILESPQDDGRTWCHTRGMRKFGRPDLSMHDVDAKQRRAVAEMFNRFIAFQAVGGLIEEGREIRMPGLPEGLRCRHGGDLDDPEFNNLHVEIGPS